MTLAELYRATKSRKRVEKIRAQEIASHNYILADLIGYSIARTQSSTAKLPPIEEAYPTLFDSAEIKEKKQEKKAELSALRFKLFADAHNKKFQGGGK